MRRPFLILSLAALTVLAGASDAFAQRRAYYGGWGASPGTSYGIGSRGYYSPYGNYGGRGYSPYYQSYGTAYQVAPSYYYAAPSYYSEPAYVVPTTQIRDSYYSAPTTSVHMTVLVPSADARVWFEGNATSQQGIERVFESPSLEPGHKYTYTIKAQWLESGQAVTRERRVDVQAGKNITVDFRGATGERVPPPLPKAPNANPRE